MLILPKMILRVLTLFLLITACQSKNQVAINNISDPPVKSNKDERYSNVYAALDGTWKGTFTIYKDTTGQQPGDSQPENINAARLDSSWLKQTQEIRVKQVYHSLSPYFQKVTITDRYPKPDGTTKKVVSKGVNKVQEGNLWCVVRKPDETVIHEGTLAGPHTLIWQRNKKNPLKIEYFMETVNDNSYEIIGWGYYQGHDPEKGPAYWFHGNYSRTHEE